MRWIGLGSPVAVLVMAAPFSVGYAAGAAKPSISRTAEGAGATVDAFHAALNRGDTKGALLLLADDALIFESGGVERTKAEYAAHHLKADVDFSKSVSSIVVRRTGRSDGVLAWVATDGRTKGNYMGKALDLLTAETMILRKVGGVWKIIHVHWSSAPSHR